MLTAVKLRSLEDERFYSVLDVALDIRAELDFHAAQTIIPIMRSVVRSESLMPGDGINMRDRYCGATLEGRAVPQSRRLPDAGRVYRKRQL
jgi:hypothetical protein